MKLLYAPGACSIGIHVLMEELGKPYEGVAVNLRDGFERDAAKISQVQSNSPGKVFQNLVILGY